MCLWLHHKLTAGNFSISDIRETPADYLPSEEPVNQDMFVRISLIGHTSLNICYSIQFPLKVSLIP